MPRHERVTGPRGAWVELTAGDAVALTFQNNGGTIVLAGTTGPAPATYPDVSISFGAGDGRANLPLSDLAPGIAATRVYAYSRWKPLDITVSHA